ncbi:hypothetical protein HDU87_007371 [Geranomyces variabilis]|uniref:Uncharacterized protein n=1 Tax=Geranomyces variabilis TaxID=109894 RepID=A0AAD5TP91_9FUNG|nr:hypothetical protein HDU87_007371 [Geranomyces variabilis]
MTAAAAVGNINTEQQRGPTLESPAKDAFGVGWLFVQEYYTFLNRDQGRLHLFYNKKSSFLHDHEGEAAATTYFGQQDIHKRIAELGFNECKVLVSNVDSQASMGGGIVVQVLGEMSNEGGSSHKFAQTFFLAPQTNGFYVLNDIFRFLKEDIETDYEESEDPAPGLDLMDTHLPEELETSPHHEDVAHIEHEAAAHPAHQPAAAVAAAHPRTPSPVKSERAATPEPSAAAAIPKPESPKKDSANAGAQWAKKSSTPAASSSEESKEHVQKEQPKTSTPAAAPHKEQHHQHQSAESSSTPAKQQQQQTSAAPRPASPQVPKPKTWATLAATNVDKPAASSPAVSHQPVKPVSVPANATAPTATTPAASAQRPTSPHKPSTNAVTEKREDNSDVAGGESKDNGFREVHRQQKRPSHPNTAQHRNEDERMHNREEVSIYLRGAFDHSDSDLIRNVFGKAGTVVSVEIYPAKRMSFVEFTTKEAAQSAMGKPFMIGTQSVIPEERRKQNNFQRGPPRGNFAPRGGYNDGSFRGGAASGRGGSGPKGYGGGGPNNNNKPAFTGGANKPSGTAATTGPSKP